MTMYSFSLYDLIAATPSVEVRFWRLVDRRDESACWLLRGANRYPRVYVARIHGRDVTVQGQRLSWMLSSRADIPAGMSVCHKCDMSRCVNPAHLFLGTHHDNMLDAAKKQRMSGERVHRLTLAQKKAVRDLVTNGHRRVDIARRFGITPQGVHHYIDRMGAV